MFCVFECEMALCAASYIMEVQSNFFLSFLGVFYLK